MNEEDIDANRRFEFTESHFGCGHPVDYYGILLIHHDNGCFSGSASASARLHESIARTRKTVLGLKGDDLFGIVHYASVFETPTGVQIEMRRLGDITKYGELLERDMFVVGSQTTGSHPLLGDQISAFAAMPIQIRRGVIAYPDEGGPPFIPKGHTRFNFRPVKEWAFDQSVTSLERAEEIWDVLNGANVVVAHGAPTGMRFLELEFERFGIPPIEHRLLDTRALSRKLWPRKSSSLAAMAGRLGIHVQERDVGQSSSRDVALLASCIPPLAEAVRKAVVKAERQHVRDMRRMDRRIAEQQAQKEVNEIVH